MNATQHHDEPEDFEPAQADRQRLRFHFARPKAITRDAWDALRAKYRAWRKRHVPAVKYTSVDAPPAVRQTAFDEIAKVLAEIMREVRA